MKTKEQIKIEIKEQEVLLSNPKFNPKPIYKQIQFLNMILLYLESGPSELFITNHLSHLEKRLIQINANFTNWTWQHTKTDTLIAPRKFYDKLNDVKSLKANIKLYNYILK